MMQAQKFIWFPGLILLLLTLASNPGQVSAGQDSQGPPGAQAGLVIQFDDGRTETRCVAFEGDELSGADLLAESDLEAIVDVSSGMGLTICQIAGEGCAYPAEPCFCQCMGGGDCAYWNYFYQEPDESEWTYSALGAAMRKVRPGSVEAWVWGDGSTPPAVEVTFEEVCMPATAVPTTLPTEEPTSTPAASRPTPAPTAAAVTPVPSPTTAPTALPTATASQPSPSPVPTAATGQSLTAYWPFGLALAGLALIGAVVWLRRR
ncbi:MAG: hypothetical protein PVF77_04015 [Anaerolineae bacterium]|jgi:hypothetical protein